jgi:hypothetical protein
MGSKVWKTVVAHGERGHRPHLQLPMDRRNFPNHWKKSLSKPAQISLRLGAFARGLLNIPHTAKAGVAGGEKASVRLNRYLTFILSHKGSKV